jgi:hypothetical protein
MCEWDKKQRKAKRVSRHTETVPHPPAMRSAEMRSAGTFGIDIREIVEQAVRCGCIRWSEAER